MITPSSRAYCMVALLASLALIGCVNNRNCCSATPNPNPTTTPTATTNLSVCWNATEDTAKYVRIGSEQGLLPPGGPSCPSTNTSSLASQYPAYAVLNIYIWQEYDKLPVGSYINVCADQTMPSNWIPIQLSYNDPTGCDYQVFASIPGFGNESQYYRQN